MKKKTRKTPEELAAEIRARAEKKAGKWIADLRREYAFDDSGGKLSLSFIKTTLTDCYAYQEHIRRDGPVMFDRFGQARAHVLLPALRDARSATLQILKLLNLQVKPPDFDPEE